MTSTQPPQTPTRRRLPFSPALSSPSRRSYGTPRRHKTPKSTRLQGVNAPQRTISQLAEEILAKLQLTFTPDLWQTHLVSRIQQGYDWIFVAGTGYGKSLIFEGLAATGGPGKALVIVSPLKALERDFATFHKLNSRLNGILGDYTFKTFNGSPRDTDSCIAEHFHHT